MLSISRSVEIQFNDSRVRVERIMADIRSEEDGNTVLLIGGVHGNEPLGVLAMDKVLADLENSGNKINGRLCAVVGNMEATRIIKRYLYKDLNRLWTRENIDSLHYNQLDLRHTEYRELKELYDKLQELIGDLRGELFVVDLHTTSGPTIPFMVTNKMEKCRNYTSKFPIPSVSGLTGFLDGTLLSYVNDLGYVGLAYEAGQHKSEQSLTRFESFIWLSLHHAGILTGLTSEFVAFHEAALTEPQASSGRSFRIISRYRIQEGEDFRMQEGFANFQSIKQGQVLAQNQNGPIYSPYDGYIFMPLYQKMGEDGFFIIREDD
ncbi:MAG: succinylglutamate desuccinylase/aspartoacylase family protein [Flavobacteriales bacterium]|nr:succinylglutamate desuccinylase/aspartoacylase family protein [Flavobacteriales bacterium]